MIYRPFPELVAFIIISVVLFIALAITLVGLMAGKVHIGVFLLLSVFFFLLVSKGIGIADDIFHFRGKWRTNPKVMARYRAAARKRG